MSHSIRLRARRAAGAAVAVLAATATAAVTLSVVAAPAQAAQDVVVSPQPDQSHPRVLNGRVYAIDTAGPLVAVGGSFTSIRNGQPGSPDQAQQWLFLYDSTTGQLVSSFKPQLTGPAPRTSGLIGDAPGVEAVEFAADGQSLYVAGWFTSVNGTPQSRIVQLNLDGTVRSSFSASANNTVNDLALVGDRLIIGGRFGILNGQPVQRLAALDPTTGATRSDFNLQATESRGQYGSYVQEFDASADGRWLAVAGNFQRIGAVPRNQLALIDLQGTTPSVANWSTDAYAGDCAPVYDDSWIRGLDISPDGSYLVVSATGAHRGAESFCDSAARWELPPTQSGDNLRATWRTLTGGDTLWASHVTESAVYVGGHQRWMNNPRPSPGGDNDGPGAVSRPGIAALDPLTGVPLSWNPGRDRGRGAEAIVSNDQYLFVGNDTDLFGGQIRQRLAALPTAGGTSVPTPVDVQLPVTLHAASGSTLSSASFDGATLGTATTTSGPSVDGVDWTGFRDGFVQQGKLQYFGPTQAFWSRPFGSTVGAATNLSSTVGYVDTNYNLTPYDQPYGVAETTAAAYSAGFVYYVKSGDAKLYRRGYSLESGILASDENVVSSRSFTGVKALEYVGDWLYAAWSDGRLYRFHAPRGQVDYASRTAVDTGSSVDWSEVTGLFATQAAGDAVTPTAPSTVCDASTPWRASYWANTGLTGAPNTTRCEATLDYNYGTGAPAGAEVPADGFSASWTRTVTLSEPGALKVLATADDGVRAYVDGVRVIDSWIDSSAVLRTGTTGQLSAGDHTLRVEYYENGGGASISVRTENVAAPTAPQAPDNLPGETTVTNPTADQVVTSNAVTVTGAATDDRGVTSVRVAVSDRNAATDKWLQADGTWGPAYAYRQATLAAPGTTETGWSVDLNLPQGSYFVDAAMLDAAGNIDQSAAHRPFTVSTTPVDRTAPTSAVTSPAIRSQVTTSALTIAGTSTDGTAVDQVRVAINDRTTNRWLQADGSWGTAFAFREATLGSRGSATTSWSLPLTLPDGSYAVDVRARDTVGNLATSSAWHPFSVSTVTPDTTKPSTVVSSPAKNATVGRSVTVTGTSTDNRSIDQVRVAVFNRVDATNKWLQADGTWGSTYAYRLATLAQPGAASTAWSLGVTLPDGLYGFDVKAVDASRNLDTTPPWTPFQVGGDTTAPNGRLSTPVVGTAARSTRVSLSGAATDNASVRLVRLEVTKGTGAAKRYLTTKGTWVRGKATRTADLAEPGARSTAWTTRLALPAGTFKVRVVPVDGSRNIDKAPATRTFRVQTGR